MSRIYISLLILISLKLSFCNAETHIPPGNVSGNWTAAGSPYLVQGEITIAAGDSLLIDPGVDVIFLTHDRLIVNGWLIAQGTETDSILFTAADTLQGRHSIRLIDAPDSSRFSYCMITYGNATGTSPEDKGGGIFCHNSSPVILHSSIVRNRAWGAAGIRCQASSNARIEDCVISYNQAYDRAGAIYCHDSDPLLYQCEMSNNSAAHYAGAVNCVWSAPTLIRCRIENNSSSEGGGVRCHNESEPFLLNCIIAHNEADQGGSFWADATSHITVENCVMVENDAPEGGCAFTDSTSSVTLHNSIVWGNTEPQFSANVDVSYCAVEGGWPGEGNIAADPLFLDPDNGDYHLQSLTSSYHNGSWFPDNHHSPCIDTGDPLSPYDLEPAPNGSCINIGTYGNTDQASLSIISRVAYPRRSIDYSSIILDGHPNPFNAEITIEYTLPYGIFLELSLFDVSGRKIRTLAEGFRAPGVYSISLDGTSLPTGIYFTRLVSGQETVSQKLLLLK